MEGFVVGFGLCVALVVVVGGVVLLHRCSHSSSHLRLEVVDGVVRAACVSIVASGSGEGGCIGFFRVIRTVFDELDDARVIRAHNHREGIRIILTCLQIHLIHHGTADTSGGRGTRGPDTLGSISVLGQTSRVPLLIRVLALLIALALVGMLELTVEVSAHGAVGTRDEDVLTASAAGGHRVEQQTTVRVQTALLELLVAGGARVDDVPEKVGAIGAVGAVLLARETLVGLLVVVVGALVASAHGLTLLVVDAVEEGHSGRVGLRTTALNKAGRFTDLVEQVELFVAGVGMREVRVVDVETAEVLAVDERAQRTSLLDVFVFAEEVIAGRTVFADFSGNIVLGKSSESFSGSISSSLLLLFSSTTDLLVLRVELFIERSEGVLIRTSLLRVRLRSSLLLGLLLLILDAGLLCSSALGVKVGLIARDIVGGFLGGRFRVDLLNNINMSIQLRGSQYFRRNHEFTELSVITSEVEEGNSGTATVSESSLHQTMRIRNIVHRAVIILETLQQMEEFNTKVFENLFTYDQKSKKKESDIDAEWERVFRGDEKMNVPMSKRASSRAGSNSW